MSFWDCAADHIASYTRVTTDISDNYQVILILDTTHHKLHSTIRFYFRFQQVNKEQLYHEMIFYSLSCRRSDAVLQSIFAIVKGETGGVLNSDLWQSALCRKYQGTWKKYLLTNSLASQFRYDKIERLEFWLCLMLHSDSWAAIFPGLVIKICWSTASDTIREYYLRSCWKIILRSPKTVSLSCQQGFSLSPTESHHENTTSA